MDMRYSVEPITTEAGLANLESDWNRLSQTSPSPNVFMTFDWFRAWSHRLADEDRRGRRTLNVLVLKQDGAVAGLSPLIHRTASRFGLAIRKLEFLGGHADYNDHVLGNDPAGQSQAIADFLAQTQDQWDLVDLRDLRRSGNTLALFASALSRAGLLHRILPEKGRCPFLPIEADSATTMQKLSGHARRTLLKRMDRASSLGLRTRIIENPQEELGLLDKLMAVEHQKHLRGKLARPFISRYPGSISVAV